MERREVEAMSENGRDRTGGRAEGVGE